MKNLNKSENSNKIYFNNFTSQRIQSSDKANYSKK